MMPRIYTGPVEVFQYDKNLQRVGPVPTYSGQVVNRSSKVGTYSIQVAITTPTWQLTNPGNGVEGHHFYISRGSDAPLIAGPAVSSHLSYQHGVWMLTVTGEDYLTYLHRMITLPSPSRAMHQQDVEGYYRLARRSAEVNIKQLVREHASTTAGRSEHRTPLVVTASSGRGGNTTLNSRFKNVHDEAQLLATTGGLVMETRMEQESLHQFVPTFDVRLKRDLSRHVVLTTGNHGIMAADIQAAAAEANRVLVAGQGEAEERTLVRVQNPVGDWNLRTTVFQDRRDTDEHDELTQAGQETLAENDEEVSISATIRELAHAKYGRDFLTGDTISLGVGGKNFTDEVTEADTSWGATGTSTSIKTGVTHDQDSLATVDHVRKLVRAIEPGRTF